MRKAIESIQSWRRLHNGRYPARIADLKQAGLMPPDGAMCPDWRAERLGARAAHGQMSSRGDGGDPPGTYEYELSQSVLKSDYERRFLPTNAPAYNRQDWKTELLRRPFFEQIPLLRCSSHRAEAPQPFAGFDDARRNTTLSGTSYWSRTYWEELWVDDVPYCARELNVLFGLKGPPFYTDRDPSLSSALDLRKWNCAFGDRAWWWTLPYFDPVPAWQAAPHLEPFFQQRHGRVLNLAGTSWWIDGLIQLQGRYRENASPFVEFRMRGFASERTGVSVERKFLHASWLQGTVWPAPTDETTGWLVWHYADSAVERVPIVYGRHTARFWGDANQIGGEMNFPEPVWQHRETAEQVGRERWLRLYRQTWANPRPQVVVKRLDFVSNSSSPAAPFLIAVNVTP